MVYSYFSIAIIGYVIMASLPFLKINEAWPQMYFLIGAGLGIVSNLTWLALARQVPKDEIVVWSVVWDAVLTLSYILVPVFLWKTPTNWNTWMGVLLVIAGMVVCKI